jgi:hypothetical protein
MTNEADRQRRERLRAALRENLKRRKAQVRARQTPLGEETTDERPDFAKTVDPGKEASN